MSEIDTFLDGDTPKRTAATSAPQAPASQIDDFLKDAPTSSRGLKGWGRDVVGTAINAAISVPELVVGLADIPTGGRVGKALENKDGAVGLRFNEAKQFVNENIKSDASREAHRKFQAADGLVDKTAVALQNPSLILEGVGESLGAMGAGGVAARGLMAATKLGQMGAKGAVIAGTGGEGVAGAGSQAEQIRQETQDGLLTPGQTAAALATGAATAGFGYAGGKVAQRLGIGDAETMMAQGIKGLDEQIAGTAARAAANPMVAEAAVKSIPRKVIEGAISEGFLEELPQSMAEQIFQNIALDKPWHEDLDSAAVMGVLSGGAMGAGAAGFRGVRESGATPAGEPAPAPGADAGSPKAEAAAQPNPGLARVSSEFAARLQALQEQEQGEAQVPQTAPPDGAAALAQQQAQAKAARDAEMAASRAVESPDDEILQSTGATAPRPSEAMGLRSGPEAGSLENAAAMSVDTGATAHMQQAAAQAQAAEVAAKQSKVEPKKEAKQGVFEPGQQWVSKSGGSYTIESVSADGKMGLADFGNGEKAQVHFDAESANGWTLKANQKQEQRTQDQQAVDPDTGEISGMPSMSDWSDVDLSTAFRHAQSKDVRRQLATELSRRRALRTEAEQAAAVQPESKTAQAPAAQQPVQPVAPGSQADGANVATLAQLNRKKLAEMSTDELRQLSSLLPADHSRQQKIQKAIQSRAQQAQAAINEGAKPDGTQTPQAQQGGAQPAKAGAAQASQSPGQGLTDGAAPAQNDGRQASAPTAPQTQTQAQVPDRQQRAKRIDDAGAQWTRMPAAERSALVGRLEGVKPVLAKNMPRAEWGNLNADIQRKLADAMAPQAVPAPAPAAGQIIGKNAEGLDIREDSRGVRSVTRNGVKVEETVELRPMRTADGGVTYGVARTELAPEFMTEAERANEQPKKSTPASVQQAPAATETVAKTDKPADYGASNKLVSQSRADELRAKLREKAKNHMFGGLDTEMMAWGTELAVFHLEAGVRKFSDLVAAMASDLGTTPAKLKPYLRSWYNGARDMMEDHGLSIEGMDSPETVRAELAKIGVEVTQESKVQTTAPSLSESLLSAIRAGNMPKDNPALKKLVEAFDGKPADPARMKEAQELLEAAIVAASREVVAKGEGDKSTFNALLRLYESQPNLNVRTSTSIANQAYSTPAPLAYLASQLAGITKKTLTHEPTAGTGMLLIGADPKSSVVNELNDLRVSLLEQQGFSPTQKDAAIAPLRDKRGPVDAVITNPPFGSVKDDSGKATKVKVDGYNLGQIDHLIAARALETMKDDGRAVLILGANKAPGGLSTDDRIFFNWLYSHYNVVGQFEVAGDLYARQGAGWPVRVIAIDGREKSANISPVAGTIERVDNWNQVYDQYKQLLDSIGRPVRRAGAAAGRPVEGQTRSADLPNAAGPQAAKSDRPGRAERTGGNGNVSGTRAGAVSDLTGATTDPVGHEPDEQRLNAQSFVPPRLDEAGQGAKPASDQRPAKPAGTTAVEGAPVEAGNEFQSSYIPRSARKDQGVLIPSNMAQPTQDALNHLEDQVGDIDDFARKELGYDSTEALHNALMGLQVDSVATAIYQIKQGKAVVIADQTGIGKGRQAASIIRWASRNGMTPVFVSVKPSLFTDMYGDLADIGTHDVEPFILNSDAWVSGQDGEKLFANKASNHRAAIEAIANNGTLPAGRNALFMTYSQINTDNVQRRALRALAGNAVFVLDESHNAAGASGTGDFMISVLKEAKGVTYLSATYAKRPDNMPLYFKTDIGDAAADSEGLASAMSAGGLPLQTVVSNNLVKAGQMFRRERSYEGVSIASTFDSKNRAQHQEMSDTATQALRAIVRADRLFHEIFVKQLQKQLKAEGGDLKDIAGNQASAGVQHTEFSSVVHNFVRQMLLGLKAQTAADEAIASLERGEKPIIAVENTMGSFLSEYAGSNGLTQGDLLGSFDYRTVLSRALERSRALVETLPTGEEVRKTISLAQLDPITRKAYDQAQDVIDGLKIAIPVSPIDWMRAEIERAGYSVAEITGRNLAVDYSDKGKPTLSVIDQAEQRDKVATTRRFNGGELDALILNVAGSTGISLHASEKFQDQRQRHMIVAQAAGDINIFMQMLGRIHRTGQVRLPKYTILSVDLPTEKRPTAVLSKKMKSLNANTSSNTESATSVKTADILNKYGDQIVHQYLQDNMELARQLDVDDIVGGDTPAEDIARKATGRLALQPIEVQNSFYEDVEAQYDALIEYLNKTNQNDLEPRTFDFDAKETRSEILFDGPNKETPFGADAIYGEYSIKAQGSPMTPDQIKAAMESNLGGKTGAEHADALANQMLQTYADQFNQSREKAGTTPDTFAIDQYTALMKSAFGDVGVNMAEEAQALIAKGMPLPAMTPRDMMRAQGVGTGMDFIKSHAIGRTFRVDINSEPFNAVVTNVRNTHKATGNPFSMSKLQLTVSVNGALRSITVPATQFKKIEVSSIAPTFRVEQLFKEQPPNQRETAKIITGNLLAAYGELKGVNGTIISFTTADGGTEQGILLPKLFDYAKNTQGDYRLRSGAEAVNFLQRSENKDIGRFGIATRDGQVRVLPYGDGVQVRVPRSKAQGARYFLDRNLIAIAGDFVSTANAMAAKVENASDAAKLLDLLMDKQALYALPSMAEEAKALAPKDAKADDGVTNSNGNFDPESPNIANFSDRVAPSPIDTFPAEFMAELAAVDELFAYPTVHAGSAEAALRQVDPTIKLVGNVTAEDERSESGADTKLLFRTGNGRDFYVFEKGDQLWLDVSRLGEGDGGNAIYSALMDYAATNDKVFIGDPAGLSDIAMRRRLEAMISSAIKRGSTDHMEPHARQVEGDEKLGVPALKWRRGDTIGNIQRMIDVSLAALESQVPDFKNIRYDFATGTYRDAADRRYDFGDGGEARQPSIQRGISAASKGRATGHSESQSLFDGADSPGDGPTGSRASRPGRRTLKRGVLLNTLLRAESNQRPGLLEQALREPGQLVGPQAQGIFYKLGTANQRRLASAQDKVVMQAIADGKSARDVLRTVASGSKDQFLRQTARLLLKAGITPNIEFGHIGKSKGNPIHGQYRGRSDTIAMAGSAEYAAERIFMHEAMHAATMRALAKPGLVRLQLQKLAAHVRKQPGAAGFYGISDKNGAVDEFVAEVFTNPDFQAALRNISAPSGSAIKTAWDGFVRILRSILGLKNDPNNALSQALQLGVAAVRQDMGLRQQGVRAEGAANFGADDFTKLKASALDQITQALSHPGKVSWWDKSFGTMRNLAERVPQFKLVFEAAQRFIDDVSMLANDAADFAPRLMPRVETLADLKKKPITAADNKSVAKPLFEGTLMWARDVDGTPVTTEALNAKYRNMPADEKAQMMLRTGKLDDRVLKMWKGMPIESFEKAVASKFDSTILKPGVVWTQKELKSIFKLDDKQVSLYQEARAAIDRSLDMTARTDMLRAMGEQFAGMREAVLGQESLDDAFNLVVDTLQAEARANPDMADRVLQMNNAVVKRYETATELMEKGYAPLSRFGKYTVDVVDPSGERQYFGMFESMREANQMADKMRDVFKGATVTQGTMSEQAFKLFQGITPESLEQFGEMLGLKGDGDEAKDKAFQAYLQLAKNNHSALKRLIHRKGIDGYSEDVGRVLASFVYSNARLGSGGLNAGSMENAVEGIPEEMGELRDVAMGLRSYIQDPQEEGQAVRGMLFAQYLGGSVASALVNMTQPFQITMPWLSQYGGMRKAAGQMARALKDMGTKGFKYESDLAKALEDAEDDGTVSPQEIHQLMAQARGTGSLRTGDGTKLGDARAAASNNWERVKVAWGQPFALAEQFNRRSTFIASYRIAQEQGMADPAEFARKAVLETQFLYSKANKMRFARGAVGGALMTFKTYSVSYLELMHRMWTQGGPEGKRAVGWAVAMLLLMGGAGGLPFMEDAEDLIDGAAQLMGYNLSTKQARKEFLTTYVGKELTDFMEQGISGLPGAPIDVSGRLGMGNLIPGTGLFMSKQNRERDLLEIAGPAGDLVARGFTGARKALTGDLAGAALEFSPTAVRNAAKGIDMATSGIYKDTKGYKVMDVTLAEAAAKFAGFQPKSVAEDSEASGYKQRTKSFYSQTSAEIKAQWAAAVFNKDDAALERVRDRLAAWNRNNPDMPITVKIPEVMKKVREMGKDREKRINDNAPKALRQQFREMAQEASR